MNEKPVFSSSHSWLTGNADELLLYLWQLPILYGGQTKIADDSRQKLFEAVGYLNTFLEGKSYVAGSEQPTIADLSIFASVANIVVS